MTGTEGTETTLEARSQVTKKAPFSLKNLHGGSSPVPVETQVGDPTFHFPRHESQSRARSERPRDVLGCGARASCLCHTESIRQWRAGTRWRELLVKLAS